MLSVRFVGQFDNDIHYWFDMQSAKLYREELKSPRNLNNGGFADLQENELRISKYWSCICYN